MKKCLFALMFCFVLFSGCASIKEGNAANNTQTKKEVYIGASGVFEKGNGLRILAVTLNEPASKAGLLVDDVIKQVNGTDITSFKQFFDTIKKLDPKSDAKLTIAHSGNTKQVTVSPIQREIPADIYNYPIRKVLDLLGENTRVSLIIIAGEISGDFKGTTEKTVREQIQAMEENDYSVLSCYPFFKIIDKNTTEGLVKDMKFSLSGIVASEFRTKAGKLTGATHILYVTTIRNSGKYAADVNDVVTEKLINVETGEVVGSATIQHKSRYFNNK
jgi:membrane-associated protease RseP (regulator of RpoE activity)